METKTPKRKKEYYRKTGTRKENIKHCLGGKYFNPIDGCSFNYFMMLTLK